MSEAQQIDQSIRKMADESSQLTDTTQELTIQLAGLIENEGLDPLSSLQAAGDAVALLIESVPAVFVQAAKSKGAILDPAIVTRANIDAFIREPSVIDGLVNSVLKKARAYVNGDGVRGAF